MWNDPRIVWPIAIIGIVLLMATYWLLRRARQRRPRAAAVCVTLSVLLHILLFWLVPLVTQPAGGRPEGEGTVAATVAEVTFSDLSDEPLADLSASGDAIAVAPLPVATPLTAPVESTPPTPATSAAEVASSTTDELAEILTALQQESTVDPQFVTATLDDSALDSALDEMLNRLVLDDAVQASPSARDSQLNDPPSRAQSPATKMTAAAVRDAPAAPVIPMSATPDQPTAARVVGGVEGDFANRFGAAKQSALQANGGDEATEAAVRAALRWLAHYQRPDGSWDTQSSGAGIERAPLGETRAGAGTRATSAITGLALLSMLGNGNTHQQGPYATNVHAGLSYLIRNQAPDGSLAGPATKFARTYSHGMAALALCEAAAMTKDPQAIAAARAAVAHTLRQQHPTTGGWRYQAGEAGDLSQLGWQAMVLESARQADIDIGARTVPLASHFLRSVRSGRVGGLACYRPGQPPSRTMTAEALATRLLLGEKVPPAEISEAETYLLQELPGDAQPNYYYWYYASLALHQLQDSAWETWNARLKQELLRSQQPDGSWPTDSVWGGYGGRVYTTAINTLSLEVYYRHQHR